MLAGKSTPPATLETPRKNGEPVGSVQRKTKKRGCPGNVHANAQGCGHEGIDGRSCDKDRERGLRDEEMLERAGVARFFQTAVESVQCGIQIIKKNETDK